MAIDYAAKLEALENALMAGELTVESDGDRVTYRSVGEIQRAIDYCNQRLASQTGASQRPATTVAQFSPE